MENNKKIIIETINSFIKKQTQITKESSIAKLNNIAWKDRKSTGELLYEELQSYLKD